MGKQWKQCQTLFFWAPKSLQMVTAAMKLKDAYSLEGIKKNKLLKTEAKAQALVIDLLFQDDEGFRDHTPEGSPSEAPSIWGP